MTDIHLMMTYVFVGLFSPGPNVVLLTASGARFGFRATVPHVFGVALGVGVIAALTGLGIGALILAAPWMTNVLKVVAALWILWMAWGLWRAKPVSPQDTGDKPFTFLQAVMFQAVNPKIWVVALAATSYLVAYPPIQKAAYLAASFSGINLFVCLFWTWAGTLLALLLSNQKAWVVFMRIMAAALAIFSLAVFL